MNALRAIPFLYLVAVPAAAQDLDSAQIRYRDALVAIRDTLMPIGAAVQSLQRDLGSAADVTVLAKTRQLRTACDNARGAMAARRGVFEAVRGNERRVNAARQLVRAMRTYDAQLAEHCLDGLRVREGFAADSVRAWLPFRSSRLRAAEQAYLEAASSFARVVEVRIPPRTGRSR